MLVVIESEDLLKSFLEAYSESNTIMIPVFSDEFRHPKNNTLCFLYIHLIKKKKSYILPFDHPECINLGMESLKALDSGKKKFVFDRKSMNFYQKFENSYDLGLINYFKSNCAYDFEGELTNCHSFFHRSFYSRPFLNKIIPILKHFELCEIIKDKVIDDVKAFRLTKPFREYNTRIIDSLALIEENGLHINENKFKKHFGPTSEKHIHEGLVYSQYNVYTTTGRPSNRYGGINYAGLNKEDGSRTPFDSRFGDGLLVQYDYDAYHLRLIAELLNFKFPDVNIHNYFAKEYFGTTEITPELYNQSKQISFRLLYGGITKAYKEVPFFKEVNEFIDGLWNIYIKNDYIETPVFKRKLHRSFFGRMSKNKLFNYFLQAYETENNFFIFSEVIDKLKNTKSKLILYTYDSYLIDFCMEDGKKLIDEFKELIEQDGKFPSTMTFGPNYNKLKKLQNGIKIR